MEALVMASTSDQVSARGFVLAPNFFDILMDCVLERLTHHDMSCDTIGPESFSDLDCADDVSLFMELMSLL